MASPPLAEAGSARGRWGWVWPPLLHQLLVLTAVGITLGVLGRLNPEGWTGAFSNWDSRWYLAIASSGYPAHLAPQWAFLPLYPALITASNALRLSPVLGGLLVSLAATGGLCYCLVQLAQIEFGKSGRTWVPWLLLLSPFGFFFAAVYTEALFFALAAAAFLAARKGNLMFAGLFGAAATMTRLPGAVLLLALLLEALQQAHWDWRRLPPATAWLLLIPATVAFLLAYTWARTGRPLILLRAETQFGIHLAWPWVGFHATLISALSGNPGLRAAFLPELTAGVIGLPVVVIAIFRLRPMYSSFMLLAWLGAVSLSFWRSVPRYEFAFFPILFLLVPMTARAPWLRWILVIAGAITMAYGASMFTRGLWLD